MSEKAERQVRESRLYAISVDLYSNLLNHWNQEFATWRRQSPPSMEEEFVRKRLPLEEFEAQIPFDLDERLEKVRKRLNPSIEHYKNACFIMERLVRRYEGQATDYVRYALALE